MAATITQLSELVQAEGTLSLEDLFDQDLHLRITETDYGVRVGLGWDPPTTVSASAAKVGPRPVPPLPVPPLPVPG